MRIPNTRICALAGSLVAGADCAYTLSPKTEEMTMEEFITWLEPQAAQPDPKRPGRMLPARAGAVCQSAEDWVKMKTVLQQVCAKVGCSKEQVRDLEQAESALYHVTR